MTSSAPMSRDEADRAIVGLVAAYDRISAAMYELDGRPGLAVLRGGGVHGGGLRGETRRVAEEVLAATDVLWSHFGALMTRLEHVKAVRGDRSRPGESELHELTTLLRGRVVGLGADGLALDHPAAGPPATLLTLAELARRLETGSADVNEQLGRVEGACARIAARWEPLAAALAGVRSGAAELGGETLPPADVDLVGERLAAAHRESLHDPLAGAGAPTPRGGVGAGGGAGPGDAGAPMEIRAREIAADIEALAARLAELTRLRDGYPQRAERLRAAVAEVAATEVEAGRASATALVKILNPRLPAVPAAAEALGTHLAQLDQFHRERRWTSLARELSAAELATSAALNEAAQVREAAAGLLDRRAELRGRLDAYRARAARLGFAEHEELSARHRAAQDLLYSSPCDLPAATRAVVDYQRYLNDLTERTVPGSGRAVDGSPHGWESPT